MENLCVILLYNSETLKSEQLGLIPKEIAEEIANKLQNVMPKSVSVAVIESKG